jgi:putative heme-binding domain-containing protein
VFANLLADAEFRVSPGGKALLPALAAQVGAANRPAELAAVAKAVDALPESDMALAGDLVKALVSRMPGAARGAVAKLGGKAGAVLADLLATARTTAGDPKATPAARAAAVRTLGLAAFADVRELLKSSLQVTQPQPVQLAALEVLTKFNDAAVPALVLGEWGSMSPQIRATAAETLLARPAWVSAFLDAVEKKTVLPADLDPARVQLLLKSPDDAVRTRAAKLFAGVGVSKRADVIAKYQTSLQLTGDAGKGKAVFKNVCSACHKLEGVGNAVGPDLASIKNRGLESVMTNVLDPNREVLPQFFTYTLVTDGGLIVAGMITAETANTVTVRRTDGTTETVQRVNIESLRSTGLSAMPEGLEKDIDEQAMADLLAYLTAIK